MSIAHVELSIQMGSDPITGSLAVGRDATRPFCGWAELAAAIEAARVAEPPQWAPVRGGQEEPTC